MKKKVLVALVTAVMGLSLISCDQGMAKNFGGNMTLELEPNQKLETITWKDDNLWYLTRPMNEEDVAETHTFRQSSEFGIMEGTVTVVETKDME